MPDITNNQAQVLTICPTLATQEVEQYVTAPIENAVRNLPGVALLGREARAYTAPVNPDTKLKTSDATVGRDEAGAPDRVKTRAGRS